MQRAGSRPPPARGGRAGEIRSIEKMMELLSPAGSPEAVIAAVQNGRVYQALEAAGGALEGAELRSLNQAAPLTDGEQITVYTIEEINASGGVPVPGGEAQAGSGKINLNTAGREELMRLSGIGEARAAAIIAYREEHGPFTAIEEVMNIEGIKEKAFSKIKDEIEV